MKNANRFVSVFRRAALQAGAVGRRLQGEVRAREKEAETPESAAISAVDLAAQDVILLALHEAFPEVAMDAEEETETAALFPSPGEVERPVIVVDPIDGTYNYLHGSEEYAVMGGWIEGGAYRASVVHFPVAGVTYWALAGEGAWRAPDRIGRPVEEEGSRVTVAGERERLLVTPGFGDGVWGRLRERGFEASLSRCSAVDGVAPAAASAGAALSWGSAGRRRSCAHFVTLEAGGAVRDSGRPWHGEDPHRWPESDEPSVVALDDDLVERVLAAARD